jgi:hypothetical protein
MVAVGVRGIIKQVSNSSDGTCLYLFDHYSHLFFASKLRVRL